MADSEFRWRGEFTNRENPFRLSFLSDVGILRAPAAASLVADSGEGFRRMRYLLIKCIRFYQRFISRWTPSVCRFHPTCSQYAVEALEKYGAAKGSLFAIKRIMRCHPWHAGGYDPVE